MLNIIIKVVASAPWFHGLQNKVSASKYINMDAINRTF